jgi:hypothetical protein
MANDSSTTEQRHAIGAPGERQAGPHGLEYRATLQLARKVPAISALPDAGGPSYRLITLLALREKAVRRNANPSRDRTD